MPQLTTPLDDILGSSSKVRVLRLLLSSDYVISGREAARRVRMSPPAVLQAMDELVTLGVALREDGGHQVRLRPNPDHALMPLLRGLFAEETAWTASLFETIRAGLALDTSASSRSERRAAGQVVAASIFGSIARGEDRPGSDLDLLVLVRTPEDADIVQDRIAEHSPAWEARFGVAVSPVVMLLDRAAARYAAGDPLLTDAVRDSRMIVGLGPLEDILRRAEPLARRRAVAETVKKPGRSRAKQGCKTGRRGMRA